LHAIAEGIETKAQADILSNGLPLMGKVIFRDQLPYE